MGLSIHLFKLLICVRKIVSFFRHQQLLHFYFNGQEVTTAQIQRNHEAQEKQTRQQVLVKRHTGLFKSGPAFSGFKRSTILARCGIPVHQESSLLEQVFVAIKWSYDDDSLNPLCRTHSYTNNYDRDIIEIKQDYELLRQLIGKSKDNNRTGSI